MASHGLGADNMSAPDTILMSSSQYLAITEIQETYERIGEPKTLAEAYVIWLRRGCPQSKEV
jgi:hypothetical protein